MHIKYPFFAITGNSTNINEVNQQQISHPYIRNQRFSSTCGIVQKVSVFVHPTGHMQAKPFTGKGLIVGTALETAIDNKTAFENSVALNKPVKTYI